MSDDFNYKHAHCIVSTTVALPLVVCIKTPWRVLSLHSTSLKLVVAFVYIYRSTFNDAEQFRIKSNLAEKAAGNPNSASALRCMKGVLIHFEIIFDQNI